MTALAFRLLLFLLIAAAVRWGGHTERFGACAYGLAAMFTELLRSEAADRYVHLEWGVFGVDLFLLAALLALTLRSEPWWPIWATALQCVTVLGHLAKLLNPTVWPLAYAWMMQASSFPSLLVLALGILRAPCRPASPTRTS